MHPFHLPNYFVFRRLKHGRFVKALPKLIGKEAVSQSVYAYRGCCMGLSELRSSSTVVISASVENLF